MDTSKIPDLEWWTGELEEKEAVKKSIKKVEEEGKGAEFGV